MKVEEESQEVSGKERSPEQLGRLPTRNVFQTGHEKRCTVGV